MIAAIEKATGFFKSEPPTVTPEQLAATRQAGTNALTALTADVAALDTTRLAKLREAQEAEQQIGQLRHRATALQSALTTLTGSGPLDEATRSLLFLRASRQEYTEALLALPAKYGNAEQVQQRLDLTLSIRVIDDGLSVLYVPNAPLPPDHPDAERRVGLMATRLGQAMREAGLKWTGTLEDTERRVAELTKQRDEALAIINAALNQ